jgi:hypothetical protein
MPPEIPPGNNMVFLVGGYDDGAAYGRVFTLSVPGAPQPVERFGGQEFGATWGGQRAYADRLVQGLDETGLELLQEHLRLSDAQLDGVREYLQGNNPLALPYQFLPLQDCVDLCILLIRTTINMQRFTVDVRGVGGPIDVATVTRTDGFVPVQVKAVFGETS